MASPLLLLVLPFLAFTAGSAPEGSNSSSSTTTTAATRFLDTNQTSVTQHTTQKPQSTADKIEFIIGGSEEDYDYEDNVSTVAYTSPVTKVSCPYDSCEHLALTCEEIQWHAGAKCLCPGIDGPQRKPDSPPLKEVLLGDMQMTVNWCSPSSTVHGYRVLHGEPGGSLEKGLDLNASFRSYTIENLHPGSPYTVCVVAFNNAGESQVDEVENRPAGSMPGPCRTVHTTMQSLYLGIGLGLAAVAGLLVILGYYLCSRKRNKTKMEVNMEEMGIPNYTYKAGSVDQL